jgi:hypothetical protein
MKKITIVFSIFLISSCTTVFYKIYGISTIISYSEKADKDFLKEVNSELDLTHIVSDSSQYCLLNNYGMNSSLRKNLSQPIQLFYFENDSLKSYHVNCTAKGGLGNINWNTDNRFEQFIPKSAVKLDSLKLSLQNLQSIYAAIKNDKKYTVIIFYTLMFKKIAKSGIKTVEKNVTLFNKNKESNIYIINTDKFYSTIF